MMIRCTGSKKRPFEVLDAFNNIIYLDDFLLKDDDDWKDFINCLEFYRERYIDGTVEQLLQNIRKSQKQVGRPLISTLDF